MSFMNLKISYWVTAAIATSVVSGALIASANKSPLQMPQREKAMSSSANTASFRFEDYETAESAQEKLLSIFPIGSSLNNLINKMNSLKADCYEPEPGDEDYGKAIACHYMENDILFVSRKWIAIAYFDGNQKITRLEVKLGAVGP